MNNTQIYLDEQYAYELRDMQNIYYIYYLHLHIYNNNSNIFNMSTNK